MKNLEELLSRKIQSDQIDNDSQQPPTARQSSVPGVIPVHALGYPDLKGKYGYFPPSMFKDYMDTAREKVHNTLYGQIDSKGIFHPANSLGSSGNSAASPPMLTHEKTHEKASPDSLFVNPSHSPLSIKIGETPATAASRDQQQGASNPNQLTNPNERMGLLGSMMGLGMYGGGMYGMPYGIYPPFMGGYGMHSMYPYGGYGMAAYNPYAMMGMYGGYGLGYGGYGMGYGGYGPWYRSENGGHEGGHHHPMNHAEPSSQAVNLGGGMYPNASNPVYHNQMDHSQFPAYIPSHMPPLMSGHQPQPQRENYYGFPPSFAASNHEREVLRPNDKNRELQEQQSNHNHNSNQKHPSSLSPLNFPYSYSSSEKASEKSPLYSSLSSPSSHLRHQQDFLEANSARNRFGLSAPQPFLTSSPKYAAKKLHQENEKDSDRFYSSSSSMTFPSLVLKTPQRYPYFSSPSTLETVGYF